MKVTGFSFVRNAILYDYPIVEAIQSILPLCDDFVVAVGKSEDDTLAMIQAIDPQKIKIIETVWDSSLKKGARFLANETDKAFQQVPASSDWAFYIQGDEVIHEKYIDTLYTAMQQYKDDQKVDGLLFKYLHFYGAYQYIGTSFNWYKNEIRIIKNNKNIYSYRDAQGFRKDDNKKLNVKSVDAYIYHYGWVKNPIVQQKKQMGRWWGLEGKARNHQSIPAFDYHTIDALRIFKGTHPKVMQKRVAQQNWTFDYDVRKNTLSFKDKVKRLVKWLTGYEMGYKNYKLI